MKGQKILHEASAGGIVYKKDKTSGSKMKDIFLWLVIRHHKQGHYGFPKGHIGDIIPTESMREAATREVLEEGGIKTKIVSDKPVQTTYFFQRDGNLHQKTVNYFLMEYISGNTEDHDHEVAEAKFVDEKELMNTLTYNTDKVAFNKLRSLI